MVLDADLSINTVYSRKCTRCKTSKPLAEFSLCRGEVAGPDARRIATCHPCSEKKKTQKQESKKKGSNKENEPLDTLDSESGPDGELSNLTLPEFLTFVGGEASSLKLEANVNVSTLHHITTRREKADALAQCVWEAMNIRFVWVHIIMPL